MCHHKSRREDDAIRDVGGEEVLRMSHPQHEPREEMTRAVESWRAVMLDDEDREARRSGPLLWSAGRFR